MIDFWTPSYEYGALHPIRQNTLSQVWAKLDTSINPHHALRWEAIVREPPTNCLHDNQIRPIARPNSHNPSSIRLRHLVAASLHTFPPCLCSLHEHLRWRNGRAHRKTFEFLTRCVHVYHIYRVACNLWLEIREILSSNLIHSSIEIGVSSWFSVTCYTSLYKMRREVEIN